MLHLAYRVSRQSGEAIMLTRSVECERMSEHSRRQIIEYLNDCYALAADFLSGAILAVVCFDRRHT